MNNLMFYPFVTGSISVIFARYKRAVSDERGVTDRGGPMVSCAIPSDVRRLKILVGSTVI